MAARGQLPTPCYVVDEHKIRENLQILKQLELGSGCHVLLAQKAFSMYALYPMIRQYISGTAASGLYEARLGREEMGLENHVYAPAYKDEDMVQLVQICDHIIFNSWTQYQKHRTVIDQASKTGHSCSIGLRVNPQCSTQKGHEIYDPCGPASRLGIPFSEFEKGLSGMGAACDAEGVRKLPPDIEGLHFHTLCEQDAEDLVTTFQAFEEKFLPYLYQVKWLNLGGGHHITRSDYHLETLINLIREIQSNYQVAVYLEPGEAIALNAGYLVCEVCDIVHNDLDILILDTSAACHMPDVLEMPYRPPLKGSHPAGDTPYTYRLSSLSCLAGDVIGDYSFDHEIQVGERLIFEDMAIYSMVKNNTFNGIPLPGIALYREDGTLAKIREFGYDDFKRRLS